MLYLTTALKFRKRIVTPLDPCQSRLPRVGTACRGPEGVFGSTFILLAAFEVRTPLPYRTPGLQPIGAVIVFTRSETVNLEGAVAKPGKEDAFSDVIGSEYCSFVRTACERCADYRGMMHGAHLIDLHIHTSAVCMEARTQWNVCKVRPTYGREYFCTNSQHTYCTWRTCALCRCQDQYLRDGPYLWHSSQRQKTNESSYCEVRIYFCSRSCLYSIEKRVSCKSRVAFS